MEIFKYLLFFIILISIISADEFVVKSFRHEQSDISGRVYSKIDVNGEYCAIIKVRTDLSNLKFYSNQLEYSEKKKGEYWLYVQDKTQYFEIVKRNFIKKGYKIPIKVKTKNVYVMELTGKREDKRKNRDKKAVSNRKISDKLLGNENKKMIFNNSEELEKARQIYEIVQQSPGAIEFTQNPEKVKQYINLYKQHLEQKEISQYRQQYAPQHQKRQPTYQKSYQIISNLSNIDQ